MARQTDESSNSSEVGRPRKRLALYVVLAAIALGLLARGVALSYAPRYSYIPDHADFMAWSHEAYESGPTRVYNRTTEPGNPWLINFRYHGPEGQTLDAPQAVPHACNYPPLATYVFWAQGFVWELLDGQDQTIRTPQQVARRLGIPPGRPVTSPLANTMKARFVGALPSIVFDFLLAWGVAALVRAVWSDRRRPLLEAAAFALVLLAPPIILDSSFWNQADSWIAALLVWCLVHVVRGRFIVAGVIYGAALLVKPQAIFLAPTILLVLPALRFMPGGSWSRMIGVAHWAGAAAVTAFLLSVPHTVMASGEPGQNWFKRSYIDTVFGDMYPRVTLDAFNVWWFDQVSIGKTRGGRDPREIAFKLGTLEVTKDRLGKLLLAASIVATWVLCARRWRWGPEAWLACAYMVCLAAFVLPTRVHERYIYLCIPFLIALAVRRRQWIIPLAMLLVVGTFEMTAFRWVGSDTVFVRVASTLLAVLSCAALVCSFVFLSWRAKPEPDEPIKSPASRQRNHGS